LDYSWKESADDSSGVFIAGEGLPMYLQPEQALDLISRCPGIRKVRALQMQRGLAFNVALSIIYRAPFLDTLLEFG
jgi:hypothetical protein